MEPATHPVDINEASPLSFADGFQFGCGFFVAAAVAALLALLVLALIGLVLSLLGVGLLEDLLGNAAGSFMSIAGS
jgi:hypothetical protein